MEGSQERVASQVAHEGPGGDTIGSQQNKTGRRGVSNNSGNHASLTNQASMAEPRKSLGRKQSTVGMKMASLAQSQTFLQTPGAAVHSSSTNSLVKQSNYRSLASKKNSIDQQKAGSVVMASLGASKRMPSSGNMNSRKNAGVSLSQNPPIFQPTQTIAAPQGSTSTRNALMQVPQLSSQVTPSGSMKQVGPRLKKVGSASGAQYMSLSLARQQPFSPKVQPSGPLAFQSQRKKQQQATFVAKNAVAHHAQRSYVDSYQANAPNQMGTSSITSMPMMGCPHFPITTKPPNLGNVETNDPTAALLQKNQLASQKQKPKKREGTSVAGKKKSRQEETAPTGAKKCASLSDLLNVVANVNNANQGSGVPVDKSYASQGRPRETDNDGQKGVEVHPYHSVEAGAKDNTQFKQSRKSLKQMQQTTTQAVQIDLEVEMLKKKQELSSSNPQQPSSSIGLVARQSALGSKLDQAAARDTAGTVASQNEDQLLPMSWDAALKHHGECITDYERQEMLKYDGAIYYVGQNCRRKIKGHVLQRAGKPPEFVQRLKERLRSMNIFNHGYDDEQGDYQVILKDHLGYRYEVLEFLGQGSFGQAIKCLDHKTGEHVAIKIIRNKKKFQYQAGMELRILKYLNHHDRHDQNNIIRVKDFMVFRKHLLIAFECLSMNLYEFIKNNNFQGVSHSLIRRFAIQILQALKYQKDLSIVHCDLKPENILLKQENKSGIKVIDFGSSCFVDQRIYTYIQSRFYRAPEIILGIPYTMSIDMWSFGCIIAELYTGYPIFPGESEVDQLAYIMEICGVPPEDVLAMSTRRHLFFDDSNKPNLVANSRGKIRQPGSKTLAQILKCKNPRDLSVNQSGSQWLCDSETQNFIDFLLRCFAWSPMERMTPLEALHHEWILQGLPDKVLQHHMKMFAFPKTASTTAPRKEDKGVIQEASCRDIQGFPPNAQNQTIYEIVAEIQAEEARREKKRRLRREQQEELARKEAATQQTDSAEKVSGLVAATAGMTPNRKNLQRQFRNYSKLQQNRRNSQSQSFDQQIVQSQENSKTDSQVVIQSDSAQKQVKDTASSNQSKAKKRLSTAKKSLQMVFKSSGREREDEDRLASQFPSEQLVKDIVAANDTEYTQPVHVQEVSTSNVLNKSSPSPAEEDMMIDEASSGMLNKIQMPPEQQKNASQVLMNLTSVLPDQLKQQQQQQVAIDLGPEDEDEEDTIEDEMVELSKNHATSQMAESVSAVGDKNMMHHAGAQRRPSYAVAQRSLDQSLQMVSDDAQTIVGPAAARPPVKPLPTSVNEDAFAEEVGMNDGSSTSSWSEMMDMSENLHSKKSVHCAVEAKPQLLNHGSGKHFKTKVGVSPSKFLRRSSNDRSSDKKGAHHKLGGYNQIHYNMMPSAAPQQRRQPKQPSAFLGVKQPMTETNARQIIVNEEPTPQEATLGQTLQNFFNVFTGSLMQPKEEMKQYPKHVRDQDTVRMSMHQRGVNVQKMHQQQQQPIVLQDNTPTQGRQMMPRSLPRNLSQSPHRGGNTLGKLTTVERNMSIIGPQGSAVGNKASLQLTRQQLEQRR